jgi:DegV family protein with EDD domain
MDKPKVAIVTDSTVNLPEEFVNQYNLNIVPLNVIWGTDTYQEGVDITTSEFYQRLKTSKELPTTSQPSAGQFFEVYSDLAKTHEGIVGVFLSEDLSGTLDSARTAAEMMKDYPIEIVDSRVISLGLGFLVLAAARAAEQNLSINEVADAARRLVNSTRFIFVVETLEYLHRGGRIGGAQRLLGSVLSMKPLLQLKDGKVMPLEKVRSKRKAINRMLAIAAEEVQNKGEVRVGVIHAAAEKEANQIQQDVAELMNPIEIIQNELSPVIGTHVGPGTVGLSYSIDE